MKIALYFSPLWAANGCPTGVGQHVLYMAEALGSIPEVTRLSLLASRGSYARHGPELPPALARLPASLYSLPESWMRRIQLFTSLIPLDRWAEGADWIYCPIEQPVATGKCRLAVMVHDQLALEPGVPGLECRPGRLAWRWRFAMNRIIERADLIVTASEFTASRIRQLCGIDGDRRLYVIGNGVSPVYRVQAGAGDPSVLSSRGLRSNGYLLSVGSLTWRKGGDTLLELAKLLMDERIDLRIIVSGQRHDADLVERMNQMKRRESDLPIELVGYVPDAELAALYRGARAFIFPSRYEGFGIPILEAMACGAPVICSDAAALPEVAGDAAIQVPPGSAQALFAAIRESAGDSTGRAGRVTRGLARAAAYTWKCCAERLLDAMHACDRHRAVCG